MPRSPKSEGKKRARKHHSHDKKGQKKSNQIPEAASSEAGRAELDGMDIGKSLPDTLYYDLY